MLPAVRIAAQAPAPPSASFAITGPAIMYAGKASTLNAAKPTMLAHSQRRERTSR